MRCVGAPTADDACDGSAGVRGRTRAWVYLVPLPGADDGGDRGSDEEEECAPEPVGRSGRERDEGRRVAGEGGEVLSQQR